MSTSLPSDTQKTGPETLLRDVASLFNTYVAKGVRVDSFVEKANPSLNVDGLDELLELYFVLTKGEICGTREEPLPGVLSFLDELPERMRRLKTTSGRHVRISQDAIRGPINWPETVTARARRPGATDQVFAYEEPEKQFDLPENRVLKRLLTVIDDIVERRIHGVIDSQTDYSWAAPWLGEENTRRVLREMLETNSYLDRVSNCDEPLPYRDIDDVIGSRSSLYRDAAALLSYHRRLQRRETYPDDARRLLKQFFLRPGSESSTIGSEGTEVLFEFYWGFKLLEGVPSPRLELVRDSARVGTVARWNGGEGRYTLYHDTASPGDLRFEASETDTVPPLTETSRTDFFTQRRRYVRSIDRFYDNSFPDDDHRSPDREALRRRPDLVVVRREENNDEVTDVFVGEVKYSRNERTVRKGVEQILETVSIAQSGDQFLSASEELLEDDRIHAGLFVDRSPFPMDQYPDSLAVFEYGDAPSLPF